MMIHAWWMIASLAIGLFSVFSMSHADEVGRTVSQTGDAGFAVVELFTSQGCSSCPPADRVLSKLAQSIDDDSRVFLLSFHVDYWNKLGWDDPYSSSAASARQREYAKAWSSRRVYTPQMVVNGKWEFNGGNEQKARLAIKEGLEDRAESPIRMKAVVDGGLALLRVGFEIQGAFDNHRLNLALVSPEASNEVPRGENRGRTLQHVNVVRAFGSQRLTQSVGQAELAIPKDFDVESGLVVAYVQRHDDAVVTGAIVKTLLKP